MASKILETYYSKGSAEPKVDSEKIIIYGNQFCPYVQRVLMVLEKYNLNYEMIGINLLFKPEWYQKVHSLQLVPYFKHGDKELYESLVIVNYLNDQYSLSLHETDAYLKAKSNLLLDQIVKTAAKSIVLVKNPSSQEADKAIFIDILTQLEEIFSPIQTKFIQGNECPKYVDYMVYPFLKLLPSIMEAICPPSTSKALEMFKNICIMNCPSLGAYINLMANYAEHSKSLSNEIMTEYLHHYMKKL